MLKNYASTLSHDPRPGSQDSAYVRSYLFKALHLDGTRRNFKGVSGTTQRDSESTCIVVHRRQQLDARLQWCVPTLNVEPCSVSCSTLTIHGYANVLSSPDDTSRRHSELLLPRRITPRSLPSAEGFVSLLLVTASSYCSSWSESATPPRRLSPSARPFRASMQPGRTHVQCALGPVTTREGEGPRGALGPVSLSLPLLEKLYTPLAI